MEDLRRVVLSDEHGAAALELGGGVVITANRAARAWIPEAAPSLPLSAFAAGVAYERLEAALCAEAPVVWERAPGQRFVVLRAPDGAHLLLGLPPACTGEALDAHVATLLQTDARRQAAAREHVLGVVSRDLRTGLALIRTAATTISRHARGQEETLCLAAEAIQRAARRMSAHLQALVDAEQVDAGRLELRLERQRLLPILEEAVEAFRPAAAEQGLRLRVEAPLAELAAACDRGRLVQALSLLLDNACRWTPPGGRVAVALRRQGARAVVEVSDTGPGIPAEDLPRVFDRGWTRGVEDGLGLGLFVARGLVEAQGGRLAVESAPGAGCRFLITLPGCREPATT